MITKIVYAISVVALITAATASDSQPKTTTTTNTSTASTTTATATSNKLTSNSNPKKTTLTNSGNPKSSGTPSPGKKVNTLKSKGRPAASLKHATPVGKTKAEEAPSQQKQQSQQRPQQQNQQQQRPQQQQPQRRPETDPFDLRPIAVGPRARYFSESIIPIPWLDIFRRYHMDHGQSAQQVKKREAEIISVTVTPVFSTHYGIMSVPLGSFPIGMSSPIKYWVVPDPLRLPVGDYDLVIKFRNDFGACICEHVMPVHIAALEITGPREPVPLQEGQSISLWIKNLIPKGIKRLRLVLASYQPGADQCRPGHADVLRDYAAHDLEDKLEVGEEREVRNVFALDPRAFGSDFVSGAFYVIAYVIAAHPQTVMKDVEGELRRREDERVMQRGREMLRKIKTHLETKPEVPYFISDSSTDDDNSSSSSSSNSTDSSDDSSNEKKTKRKKRRPTKKGKKTTLNWFFDEATMEKLLREEEHNNNGKNNEEEVILGRSVRKEHQIRWEKLIERRRQRLEYEAEQSKEYMSFVLGRSQPFYIYRPSPRGTNFTILRPWPEFFTFPNSNSTISVAQEFVAEVNTGGDRTMNDNKVAKKILMGGKACGFGMFDTRTNQTITSPPPDYSRDGPTDLSLTLQNTQSNKVTKVEGRTNFLSTGRILPRFQAVLETQVPFRFIFRLSNRGLRSAHNLPMMFRNSVVELSVPNCIVCANSMYGTEPHYRVLARVPVNFGNRELFPEGPMAPEAVGLFGVTLTVSPQIIPKELLGGRNFMLRFISDVVLRQRDSPTHLVRRQLILAESHLFSLVNNGSTSKKHSQVLVPDNLLLPANFDSARYRCFYPIGYTYVNYQQARDAWEQASKPRARKPKAYERDVPETPLGFLKKRGSPGFHPMASLLTPDELQSMVNASIHASYLKGRYESETETRRRLFEQGLTDSPAYRSASARARTLKRLLEDTLEYLEQSELKFKMEAKKSRDKQFRAVLREKRLMVDVRNTRSHWPARMTTPLDELMRMATCQDGLCATPMGEREALYRTRIQIYAHTPHLSIEWLKSGGAAIPKEYLKRAAAEAEAAAEREEFDPEFVERAFKIYQEAMMEKHGYDVDEELERLKREAAEAEAAATAAATAASTALEDQIKRSLDKSK